jgi:hypothetical protein
MKRVLVAVACTLVLGLVATQAAAETKWVRGKVTAVSGDSLTVDVMGKPMTFKVDSKTDVIARGGSTATREAQAAGQKGAALTDIIKAGDGVEVHYNEMGATMMATEIRGGVSVGAGAASKDEPMAEMAQGSSVRGLISKVTGKEFTVKADGKEYTFMVDAKTRFVGRGLSTATRQAEAAGKDMTLDKTLGMNDEVTVSYEQMGNMMHAREVRIQKKGS